MSGARVFLGHRSGGELRLLEVWTYEDATRFPWTFVARNLPTVADIGLRKLVKLLERIPGDREARGVGREAVEEWLKAPKAFGLRGGPGSDMVKVVRDLGAGYPVGMVLDADDNLLDIYRPGVKAQETWSAPEAPAAYLKDPRYPNVIRLRPRELRGVAQELAARLEGREQPMPDHLYWEEALLRREDASVLSVEREDFDVRRLDPTPEQMAVEDAIRRDDHRTLRFLLDVGTDVELTLSWRAHTWRPVTLAARRGSIGCLELLLERGAEVSPEEVERAAEAGRPEVVRLLLDKNPSLRPKPRRRFFPGDGEPDGPFSPSFEGSDPGQASPA